MLDPPPISKGSCFLTTLPTYQALWQSVRHIHSDKAGRSPGWDITTSVGVQISRIHGQAHLGLSWRRALTSWDSGRD